MLARIKNLMTKLQVISHMTNNLYKLSTPSKLVLVCLRTSAKKTKNAKIMPSPTISADRFYIYTSEEACQNIVNQLLSD
uniref:Uncharacterized protein n=1 Tax=Rhizophagus irregularis (strain DAOM 181602 / DAOM 197198 / MUCL 43194) TaxID=747089 RepID=U9V5D8_RHIID